jgi:hypothetical protein
MVTTDNFSLSKIGKTNRVRLLTITDEFPLAPEISIL